MALLLLVSLVVLPSVSVQASHMPDEGALSTRWVRPGFAEGYSLATADLDRDGAEEVIYGGRKVAAFEGAPGAEGETLWWAPWNHVPPENVLDGGDNTWATAVLPVDATDDDIPDMLVTSSDTDAYLLNGATGEKVWHNEKTGGGLSHGAVLVDADDDGVPDLFPTGGVAAISGRTGAVLWEAAIPKGARRAASGDLDGDGRRDVIVGITPPGAGTHPSTWADALTATTFFAISSSGQTLYDFETTSTIVSLVAADVDGDGVDEAIIGTYNGAIYALDDDGSLLWTAVPSEGQTVALRSADIDGDGRAEILAGTNGSSGRGDAYIVSAIDDVGAVLWGFPVSQPISALQVAQLNDDGAPELLVGTGERFGRPPYGSAYALRTTPASVDRRLWRIDSFSEVLSFDVLQQGGNKTALIGAADGLLRGVDAWSGEISWTRAAGGYVSSVEARDLDGDGTDELISGDRSGILIVTDSAGTRSWEGRLDIGTSGGVTGIDTIPTGNGRHDVVASGQRLFVSGARGVVERYGPDGSLVWSRTLDLASAGVVTADLDGDGGLELVVPRGADNDGKCGVTVLDADSAEILWDVALSSCIGMSVNVGDIEGDGKREIFYGEKTLFTQPHIALIRHDGEVSWHLGIETQVFWTQILDGALIHGGFGESTRGSVTERAVEDGSVVWKTLLPDDDDYGSTTRFRTTVPDLNGDGNADVVVSSDDAAVYAISSADGSILWRSQIEGPPGWFTWHHSAGPIAYLEQDDGDGRLVVAEYGIRRSRAETWVLAMDGTILEGAPMEGEAHSIALFRLPDGKPGVAVGAGLGVYGFDPCQTCRAPGESIPTSLDLVLGRQQGDIRADAFLIDEDGAPVVGRSVTFTLNGGAERTAVTNDQGVATVLYHRSEAKAGDEIVASFSGDEHYSPSEDREIVPQQLPLPAIGGSD